MHASMVAGNIILPTFVISISYTSYLGPSPALHHKYCILITWDLAQPFTISIAWDIAQPIVMLICWSCEGILARALIDRPHLLVGKSCMRFYSEWRLIYTYSIYAATMNDYFASLDFVARCRCLAKLELRDRGEIWAICQWWHDWFGFKPTQLLTISGCDEESL